MNMNVLNPCFRSNRVSLTKCFGDSNPDTYVVKIRYNRVHGYGLGMLNDFGGIYTAPGSYGCTGNKLVDVQTKCYNYKVCICI